VSVLEMPAGDDACPDRESLREGESSARANPWTFPARRDGRKTGPNATAPPETAKKQKTVPNSVPKKAALPKNGPRTTRRTFRSTAIWANVDVSAIPEFVSSLPCNFGAW